MMAIGVHVARVGLFTTDGNGNRIDKNDASTTLGTLKSTAQEHLVIPDSNISNSSNYPTIKAYLIAEAADDYVLSHLDQSFVITYSQSDINGA